jgi:CspA family cold shock protein
VNFTVKGAPYRHCQPEFASLSSNINSGDREGYGFIQPESGGKDMFVHISAVEKAGLSSLHEGQVVEYEEVADKGKTSAQNLKVQR